jgi:hypothetical protein
MENYMKKILCIMAFMFLSSVCFAGTYEFEDSARNDPDLAICKDMMANLKALGEPPMVCDRKFHPKFKQFSRPKWQKLDPWDNRDLIYQIWEERYKKAYDKNYPYADHTMRVLEGSKKYLKNHIERGEITLAVANFNIGGKSKDILQFVEDNVTVPCKAHWDTYGQRGRQHFFVDMNTHKVDFEATHASMLLGLQGEPNEHYGDVFLHKGVPYAALWYGNHEKGTLVVKGGREDYCAIEYEHKTGQSSKNGAVK